MKGRAGELGVGRLFFSGSHTLGALHPISELQATPSRAQPMGNPSALLTGDTGPVATAQEVTAHSGIPRQTTPAQTHGRAMPGLTPHTPPHSLANDSSPPSTNLQILQISRELYPRFFTPLAFLDT